MEEFLKVISNPEYLITIIDCIHKLAIILNFVTTSGHHCSTVFGCFEHILLNVDRPRNHRNITYRDLTIFTMSIVTTI